MTIVYRIFDADDDLLYIGCTDWPAQRFCWHRKRSLYRDLIARIDTVEYPTRDEALRAEEAAIIAEHPHFNTLSNQWREEPSGRKRRWTALSPEDQERQAELVRSLRIPGVDLSDEAAS